MKVLVTGASRGIGRGIAAVLARDGFELGLIARSADSLEEARRELAAGGAVCHAASCDLRDARATEQAVAGLVERLGGIYGLINNAGLVIRKNVFALSLEEWRSMLETNVSGVFHATRAVLPHLRAQGRGHIINVSSISGRVPLAGGSGYAATKYAVTGFSESLFLEVRDFGIKVTAVFPGSVDTASHRRETETAADNAWKVRPEEVGEVCRDVLRTAPGNCVSQVEIRPLRKPRQE
jgi:NADP-dependent 3-hydroxy acid dehydrogenase YdfG